jgi:Uma2 family endonuclease
MNAAAIEGGIAPQVVFEILSKSNTKAQMQEKFEFYDKYGVQEYYIYDPRKNKLQGGCRTDSSLKPIEDVGKSWVSPLLKIRFDLRDELILTRPDGKQFFKFRRDSHANGARTST